MSEVRKIIQFNLLSNRLFISILPLGREDRSCKGEIEEFDQAISQYKSEFY